MLHRPPGLVVAVGLASIVAGGLLMSSVPQESFPDFVRNQFAVEVYLPVGSSLDQTGQVMTEIEDALLADERIEEVASFIGTSSPRFNTLYAPQFPARHYGQMVVITTTSDDALSVLDEYSKSMSECFPGAQVLWKQLRMATSDTPIEVRISGEEPAM